MQSRPREPRPAQPRGAGELVFGLRAGLAVFQVRRGDILRVAFGRALRNDVTSLAEWAASHHVPVREMPDRELDQIAEGPHHEGLIVSTRPRRWASPAELADTLLRTKGAAVALDRVRNPYNVGAILRSAAFFGFDAVLLGALAPHPALPPLAVRVAEGAVEHLLTARTTDLADTLGRLHGRGVQIVGADGRATRSSVGFAFLRPTVLVVGNEREGLHERVRARCGAIVSIAGAGAIESLNVAVAAGVLMAETVRGAGKATAMPR